MPQIFQVLCCYKCEMFQVHQVKKSNKWQCRVCNEKQSLKKAFKIGSSRDCRFLVQKLNIQKCGHIVEENEDLEICRSDNSLFENEDASSELPGCVERENSCFSVEDSEIADSAWLKDSSNSYSDSISKTSEENVESYKKDFQSENTRLFEIFHSVSDCGNESSQKIISDSKHELLCEQSVLENMHKHSLETQANAISNDTTSPPLKKNRGFQFILKAASKLN